MIIAFFAFGCETKCGVKLPMLDIRKDGVLVFQEMFSGVYTCAISSEPVPDTNFEYIEAVFEILQDPDFEKRWNLMYTLNSRIGMMKQDTSCTQQIISWWGVIMQHIDRDDPDIFAFYSEQEDQGFEDIGHGEILIGYEMINGQAKRLCCDGMTAIYEAAGETYDVSEPGSLFIPWFN